MKKTPLCEFIEANEHLKDEIKGKKGQDKRKQSPKWQSQSSVTSTEI